MKPRERSRDMPGKQAEAEADTHIEVAPDSFTAGLVFHVVYDVLAFLLFMHHQIPSMLQDMTLQFDFLQTEQKQLGIVLAQNELDTSSRRKNIGRKREVKLEIRRVEKLMNAISGLQTAFQLLLCEVPNIADIIFVFGGSPRRPQHAYQICLPSGRIGPLAAQDMTRCRTIEVVSKKVIRALISKGVGSASYTGPSKLFLLVKAPASFNMPMHFLPKREFQCTNKTVPFRLKLKCRRNFRQETDDSCCVSDPIVGFNQRQNVSDDLMCIPPLNSKDSAVSGNNFSFILTGLGNYNFLNFEELYFIATIRMHDMLNLPYNVLKRFQCRHVVKGIVYGNPSPEE